MHIEQETRWGGGICKSQNTILTGKDSRYMFLWTGNKEETGSVGILLARCLVANIFDTFRISDWIILLKQTIDKGIYAIISDHSPQSGLTDKDNFSDGLRPVVAKIPTSEILIILGDWNGHVG